MTIDYKAILASRKTNFLNHLRTKGLDLPSVQFLRESVYTLNGDLLAINSEGAVTDTDDESEMTITRTITTPAKDRYGDIVLPRGCMKSLDVYKGNPQVFFSHKSNELPIASAVDIQVFDDKIISTAKFHEETEEARVVWRLRKLLKSTSIGFLPVKASIIGSNKTEEQRDEERIKERREKTPDGEKVITFDSWFPLRFLEWELIEWSVVPIPANPECCDSLQKYLSDGMVEGEKIPLTISKALSPYKHKGRVWVHGFEPSKEKHTGLVQCGAHELEFKDGVICKIDSISISSDAEKPIPVPDPGLDNPPSMKKPNDPLLNSAVNFLKKKDVEAGMQDPRNPKILAVKDMCQPDHFSCGLYATWEVAKYFGVGPDTREEWDKLLGTSIEESTHPDRIVKTLTDLGLTIEARQGMCYEDLELQWKCGHPVIVCCQDYGVFVPKEAKFPYGHYLVVKAACLDKVIVQDSSADNVTRGSDSIQEDGTVMIDRAKWEENWVDVDVDGNKYDHFGIVCCFDGDIPPPVELVEEAKKFLGEKG